MGGHLWVFCVFFAPALPLLIKDSWYWTRGKLVDGDVEGRHVRGGISVLIVLIIFATVAMVAVFTDAAAAGSDFEKWRLHGRYVAALLPLMLGYAVAGVDSARPWAIAGLGLIALWTFALVGNQIFQIYPWDYPDLMGLFALTPGRWSFDGAIAWTCYTTLGLGTACWVVFMLSGHRRVVYVFFVAGALLLAHAQTGAWLAAQVRNSQPSIDAGNGMAAYLGEQPAGTGMIATADRFGQVSYLLAAIDSMQYVRWIHHHEVVRRGGLPKRVHWLVADDAVAVDIPTAAMMRFGPYRLFLIDGATPWPSVPDQTTWDDKPLSIVLADPGGLTTFTGFNAPEGWGRWSESTNASIELPVRVQGPVLISVFGWSSNPQGDDVVFQLGDSEMTIHMTGQGADYKAVLNPHHEAGRLYVKGSRIETSGPRKLGVALARIELKRP
jgi:hypothetical protein